MLIGESKLKVEKLWLWIETKFKHSKSYNKITSKVDCCVSCTRQKRHENYFLNFDNRWARTADPGGHAAEGTDLRPIRLLGLWVQIEPAAWRFVSCVCCVLSGRGICVGLIHRLEESNRVSCVWAWSWTLDNEEALTHWGCCANNEQPTKQTNKYMMK